jgi:hypothetical protein
MGGSGPLHRHRKSGTSVAHETAFVLRQGAHRWVLTDVAWKDLFRDAVWIMMGRAQQCSSIQGQTRTETMAKRKEPPQ